MEWSGGEKEQKKRASNNIASFFAGSKSRRTSQEAQPQSDRPLQSSTESNEEVQILSPTPDEANTASAIQATADSEPLPSSSILCLLPQRRFVMPKRKSLAPSRR